MQRHPAVAATIALSLIVLALLPLAFSPGKPIPSPTARRVALATQPAGAQVVLIPLHPTTGMPQSEQAVSAGTSPIDLKCEPGDYLVVAHQDDQLFHEVYRHVPAEHEKLPGIYPHLAWNQSEDTIQLPTVVLFDTAELAASMLRVAGGSFNMPSTDLAGETLVILPDFFVNVTETTVGALTRAHLNLPVKMAQAGFADDDPVHDVTWHDATAYAESLGKRLLREEEFQYLVTLGGSSTDATGWEMATATAPGPVNSPTFDRLNWPRTSRPLVGMRSNVLEWTSSWWAGNGIGINQHVVRGGYTLEPATEDESIDYTQPPPRIIFFPPLGHARLGFRCARSAHPSIRGQDLVQLRVAEP